MRDFARILKADPIRLPKGSKATAKQLPSPGAAAYTNGQEGNVAGWPVPPLRQDGKPNDLLGYEFGGGARDKEKTPQGAAGGSDSKQGGKPIPPGSF